MSKVAVVLFNLGGPDSKGAIRPFLMNFFMDKNIIRLPLPLRWLVAKMISTRRSKNEAGSSYNFLGDKSPLLENTHEQAVALEQLLNAEGGDTFKTFIAMRYWHPLSEQTAKQVKDWAPGRIVLLPLYPQYSTTTTRSSLQAWNRACRDVGLDLPTSSLCCYPTQAGFIRASALNVLEVYKKAELETGMPPRILFSAHGLPEKIIDDGDPYQWQATETAKAIVAATGLAAPDWQVCYQSRVGRLEWIKPSTEDALHKAAKDGVPVIILPHAFTQEHVETLVEIDIEYRHVAETLGVPGFYRVPCVGTHPDFIRGLADMTLTRLSSGNVAPETGTRLCPPEFTQCCLQECGQKACHCC